MALDPEVELAEDIGGYTLDPAGYVYYAFPWGEPGTPLANMPGEPPSAPKRWQLKIMDDIKTHLNNPLTRCQPLKIAVSSGNGIGKSALVAMLTDWAMATCANAKVVITANTENQLKTKTSPEINKWHEMSICKHWFEHSVFSSRSKMDGLDKTWRTDLIAWNADNPDAFSGLHNAGNRILLIFDEASGIDPVIWEYAHGALTDKNTEIIWLAFGNPNRNKGEFFDCFGKNSKDWIRYKIDSRTVEGINTDEIARWELKHGADSSFFRVRVRGEFPNSSLYQFFPTNTVEEAFGKHLHSYQYDFAPYILSCDPAWWGEDDIVIAGRQGLKSEIHEVFQKNDNDVLVANIIARLEDKYNAAAVFIDMGYGTGIYSVGKTMGRAWTLIAFGGASSRPDCKHKSDEMTVEFKEWLDKGGAIPPDDELKEEMISLEALPQYDGKYCFPSKKDIKDELGRSPNKFDAIKLTFALPVQPINPSQAMQGVRRQNTNTSVDPITRRLGR